jgi:hypothetical protein
MKGSLLTTLLLIGFLAVPLAAQADHSDACNLRGPSSHEGCWMKGGGYDILLWDGSDWRRAPGTATDVGNGWVIGTDRRDGGYGIYRWTGRGWQRAPGAAVRIGGSYERPWVVNNRGERFTWNGYDWSAERRYRDHSASSHDHQNRVGGGNDRGFDGGRRDRR